MFASVPRKPLPGNIFHVLAVAEIHCASSCFTVAVANIEEVQRLRPPTSRRQHGRRNSADRRQPVPATLRSRNIAERVRRTEVPGPVVSVVEMPAGGGMDRAAAPSTVGLPRLDDFLPSFARALMRQPIPALGRRLLDPAAWWGESSAGWRHGRPSPSSMDPRHRPATTPRGRRGTPMLDTHAVHSGSAGHWAQIASASRVRGPSRPSPPSKALARPAQSAPGRRGTPRRTAAVSATHGAPVILRGRDGLMRLPAARHREFSTIAPPWPDRRRAVWRRRPLSRGSPRR
jgi:hypothetical protein